MFQQTQLSHLLKDTFGTPYELERMLVERGHSITANGIYRWGYNGTVPTRWLKTLVALAEENGKKIDIADLLSD